MKRTILMLLGAAMIMGCKTQVAETYTDNRVVEDGGTGPYKAIMVTEPSLEAHTIFRPEDLIGHIALAGPDHLHKVLDDPVPQFSGIDLPFVAMNFLRPKFVASYSSCDRHWSARAPFMNLLNSRLLRMHAVMRVRRTFS